MKKKSKKANTVLGVVLVSLLAIAVASSLFALYNMGAFSGEKQSVVNEQKSEIIKESVEQSKSGDIASIGVYVRDISNNNINTKVAVATYCQDDDGNMVIDGTASSTTAEITGKTSYGNTIKCWAFNATYQTLEPTEVTVDEEYKHIVIDSYHVPTVGKLAFYTDTLATGTAGAINVTSVTADGTGTLAKLRYTNNQTDKIIPLAGIYFNTVVGSNVSKIDVSGGAVISGGDHASTMLVDSTATLATSVSSRKDNWDYVFEFDDDSSKVGNQPLVLEENDYVESGSVRVTGDGDGCSGDVDLISSYGFTKGYYRMTKGTGVGYGHETDASSAAVITSDITGETFYATG